MMPRRLISDESGMAMALAIFVMVIVGVMGAGLLVFVTTDLTTVIQSNQGQRAFNLADAGVQAAKAHLLTDADPPHYDGVTNLAADPPNTESEWSYSGAGKTLNLDGIAGNSTKVTIRYLLPSTTSAQLSDPNYAPELVPSGQTNYAVGRDYFKVISEGRVGDARRRVEAIYNTVSLDVPRAYYTPGNIELLGSATITNISMFAKGDVKVAGGATLTGKDLTYKKWAATSDPVVAGYTPSYPNSYNSTPRLTDAAGIGAVGNIDNEVAGRDYDGPTTEPTPRFVQVPSAPPPSQPTTEMTFPFNPNSQPNMDEIRSAAQAQGSYYEISGNSTSIQESTASGTVPKWPAVSSVSTVVYVKFTNGSTSNTVSWDVDGAGNCNADPVRGTLVLENGTFTTQPNKVPLRGVIIIRGAGPGTEVYSDTGNTCMQAFINASGDIKIAGSVTPATEERGNRPGFYTMNLWSWRELYS
jgi:hypothetical protein